MSTRPDQERSISEWLVAQASESAPERLLEASRERIRSTRQRRAWWPAWRIPEMNNTVRIVLAAAAVVVIALLGYQLLVGSPAPGGPPASPSEAPSATPDATPVPSTIPTLEAEIGALFPGTYLITDVEPFTITITIPEGWESLGVPAQVWGPGDPRPAVGWYTVDDLFAEPCDSAAGYLGVGPTVDDLVQALSSYPGVTVSQTAEVTLSGFAGTSVELSGDAPDCGSGEAVFLTSQPGSVDRPFPGARTEDNQMIILDVAGDRLVISAHVTPATDEEAQSIIDSTVIEAP